MNPIGRTEYALIESAIKRLATEIYCINKGEDYIRTHRQDIVEEEPALNASFRERLGTDETYNFIAFLLYDLPTLRGVNALLTGEDPEYADFLIPRA